MAGLQRSATTFRRSGSSGLVWDERFLTEADADAEAKAGAAEDAQPELRHSRSVGSGDSRSKKAKEKRQKQGHKESESARSNQQVFRTKDVAPDMDPPSPRVSGCVFCAVFGAGSGGARRAQPRRRSKPRRK